jgi:hypothetical protein
MQTEVASADYYEYCEIMKSQIKALKQTIMSLTMLSKVYLLTQEQSMKIDSLTKENIRLRNDSLQKENAPIPQTKVEEDFEIVKIQPKYDDKDDQTPYTPLQSSEKVAFFFDNSHMDLNQSLAVKKKSKVMSEIFKDEQMKIERNPLQPMSENYIHSLSTELREGVLNKDIPKLTKAIFKIKEMHLTSLFDIPYAEQKLAQMIEEQKLPISELKSN